MVSHCVYAATAVLLLPGMALESLLARTFEQRLRFSDSIALSIALTALLAYMLSFTGFSVKHENLVAFYILCALIVAYCVSGFLWKGKKDSLEAQIKSVLHVRPTALLVIVLVFGVIALRLIQIRDLVLPNWVDSLHHTLFVQLLRDQGAIPSTISAFGAAPFFYHFGFHAVTAAFAELAGLSSDQAVLLFGQLLNASIVLSVYRLGRTVTHRARISLTAALFTGFISQMPAYYVSWGRYTLLTGMLLLPVAMSNALELWQAPGDWRRGLRLMVLTAGLCLTHYIVAVMFACFLIAVVLYFRIGLRSSYRATSFRALLGWSMLSLGVAAPWILRVLQYASPRAIVSAGLFGALPSRDHLSYWWHLLNNARSWFLIGLATLAVTAFAFKRNKLTGLLLTWLIIMAMLFTEWPWQIPPFRPDLLLICAFLPINVMAAEGLDWLLQRFTWMPQPKARRLLTLGTWTVLLLWGGIDTATVINPQTLLATKADVTAIGWIQQNTPENARFLINVAPWQSDIYRGTDGGWWIPVLSDRETLLPPGIQYGHGNSDYKAAVKAMSEELLALHGCSQAFWHFALENHITHIYIGEEAGLLQPYWFDQCSGVHRIYLSEDVHIYEIPASQPLCCAYLESSACEENAFMLARFPAAFSKALLADGTSAPGSRHSMMDP